MGPGDHPTAPNAPRLRRRPHLGDRRHHPLPAAEGQTALGLGLAFSLGHSSVVFGLSVGIAFAAQAANRFQAGFADIGGVIGTARWSRGCSCTPSPL
ncbi:HoxN/HupN/NixA family nickel/cobalt transporter [Streptomyces canus]|uniref:HoxN/HupN/NixA family nickel/cobalt transporter n=1 Tax=Streptomyces canus TaxID=58343 RepID=UPI0027D87712|nr:hypothetical protein [Streptomyces canus]